MYGRRGDVLVRESGGMPECQGSRWPFFCGMLEHMTNFGSV